MGPTVSTEKITCPSCNAIAIIEIRSCGCQTLSYEDPIHRGGCIDIWYFDRFKKRCSKHTHKT